MTPLGALLAGLAGLANQRQQHIEPGRANASASALLLNATFASPIGVTSTLAAIINATATPSTAGAPSSLAPLQAAAAAAATAADQCADQIATPANVSSAHLGAALALGDEHLYVRLSTFWYCFLAFITTLGLAVSLVSNMIIIYLFTGTPSLRRNPSNIIAVNLSLSDLLYCIQWPSVIYCSLTQTTWLLEIDYVCQTFGFITLVTASASILTVLAMSIERALVIKYSLHARNRFAMHHAWLVLLLIWCTSLAISLPPLFGTFNKYTLDPSKTSCTLDYLSNKPNYKLYTLVLYLAYWFVPTVIITICYALIIRTFGSSSRSLTLAGAVGESRRHRPDAERPARLSSVSCELTGGARVPRRQDGPLASKSVSLRSTATATTRDGPAAKPRGRPSRLRDSIRLHNFMGQLATTSGGTLPKAPPGPAHGDARPTARQASTDDDFEGEEEEARTANAATSLSLCTSSTFEDDEARLAGELSELDLEPSSVSTASRHDMHRVDSIVAKVSPLYHEQERERTFARPPGWRWQKFAANFRARRPAEAPAPTRSGKFSFDASARSKTCYELSSLRSARDASGASMRTTNLNMSASTLGRATAETGRPRLRSVACHFGGSSAPLSRTSMQIRLAKMSFYLILLWLVSWTPIASLAMINSVVKCHHRASALAVFLANTMTKLGPAFDVFIYGVSHPRIKKKFRQIIKWHFMFGRAGSGSRGSTDSERRADSLRDARNASIRYKCRRPNASLAVY